MKQASRILVAFIVLSLMTAVFGAIPASASFYDGPPLLMTEFTMNPAGVDFRGEYVEIYNCSSEPINLKDYKLAYKNSKTNIVICFNEITKYAKSDITMNGAVEPEQAILEPGEVGVIWIKGNSGTDNASTWTTEDFLNSYFKLPDEVNMFVAEHDVTSSGEFVTGGNFYMLNHSGEDWIYLYLVRKEATPENYQDHIITGFESKVADFATNAYVHLQYDETTGLMKVLQIVQGDRIMANEWLGLIMPEQDPFFDPSTTTLPPETNAPDTQSPVVTTASQVVTTAPSTEKPTTTAQSPATNAPNEAVTTSTSDTSGKKNCKSTIDLGIFAILIPAAAIIRKRKK